MKIIAALVFSILSLIFQSSNAQVFDVDTLQYQGTSKNMLNLVILGDGYTENQLEQFSFDAKKFKEEFFNQAPFRQYSAYFNVFIIKVPSLESGVKHKHDASDCPKDTLIKDNNQYPTARFMPSADPDNYFGSSFDNNGLHRLVVAHRADRIQEVLNANVPEFNQAIILSNSPYYGGSGGRFPTTTVNIASNNIAIHELGHSFADLADEYWPGLQFLNESTNRSQYASPDQVAWKKWIGTNGIGVYSYGGTAPRSVWFRPHEYCKMQYLVAPFCSVCAETIIEKIHSITNPVIQVFPDTATSLTVDALKIFSVQLAKPQPNTLKAEWFLNGKFLISHIDSIRINPGLYLEGRNTISMTVTDTTTMVRTDEHLLHKTTVNWVVDNNMNKELALPSVRWDNVQACYHSATVLSVKEPQAGIHYSWYNGIKKRKPIAIGTNFITPYLDQETTYYLEAGVGKRKTARVPVTIRVLPEIRIANDDILQQSQGDSVLVTISNSNRDYDYRWFLSETDLKPIGGYYSLVATKAKVEEKGLVLKVPGMHENQLFYLEAVSKTNSCFSKRIAVSVKGKN